MITSQQVRHVARLARLHLSEAEAGPMTRELSSILDYIDQLNQVDTTGVPAAAHALPLQNILRADAIAPGLTLDEALANAPQREGDFVRVPKIL